MSLKNTTCITLLLFPMLASAQGSVTLYGVVDATLEYVNHNGVVPTAANQFNRGPDHDVARLSSGGLSGSRWGIRGTEALGSGLTSVFVLESGFAIDSGTSQQGGRLFGRQAYVGLQRDGFGQISFGRQYTSVFDVTANFVPAVYATLYEPAVLQQGPNYREDNTIKYSGTFGALSAVAHWSFGTGVALPQTVGVSAPIGGNGEVPGQFRRDTAYGAALSYGTGPFSVMIGYDQWNPTIGTGSGTAKKALVGGSYSIGSAKIMGGYRWAKTKNAQDTLVQRDDFYWLGVVYQVTSPLSVAIEYNYDNVKSLLGNTDVPNPWQIAIIVSYSFSKRTDVYITSAYAKNAGLMLESQGTVYANSLALANSYVLGNGQSNMLGVGVGIRHRF